MKGGIIMGDTAQHVCDKDFMLGSLKTEIGNLKTGLEQADDILRKIQKEFNSHLLNANTDVSDMQAKIDSLSGILTEQTKRVTALLKVTAANTRWLQANGKLVETVEDHEVRVTDLEHNRSFVKGVMWLIGILVTFFGLIPFVKRIIYWVFCVNAD